MKADKTQDTIDKIKQHEIIGNSVRLRIAEPQKFYHLICTLFGQRFEQISEMFKNFLNIFETASNLISNFP